jgi:hypothetical protein
VRALLLHNFRWYKFLSRRLEPVVSVARSLGGLLLWGGVKTVRIFYDRIRDEFV